MPNLVTDPDILRQLNAPDPQQPSAAQPLDGQIGSVPQSADVSPVGQAKAAISAGAPHDKVLDRLHDIYTSGPSGPAVPQSNGGQTPGMTRVTDPALLEQLNAPETPGVRFATPSQPGSHGLAWDKDGGRDPQSGELVVGGRPFSEHAPSQGLAAGSSFLFGVPIVGPYLQKGAVKAGAALRHAFTGDPADQTESAVQGDIQRSEEAYPKTSTAAEIAGGVVGTAPLIAEAPAMFGAGPGGLTGGKVAAGAGSGFALGGADGAVRSSGDMGAIERGALGGAAGGAAGPVVGSALSRGMQAGAESLARIGSLRGTGLSRPAADIIARSLDTDGAQAAPNIREAGPNAMLADAGPATSGLLDTSFQRAGPGASAAREAVQQRAAGADHDLTVHLDRALGAPQGIATTESAIRDSTAAARHAAYERAYDTPINYTTDAGRSLEDMIRNRVPPMILARAANQMRIDGTPSRQLILRADGTLEQLPDVKSIDYVTRSLQDVARAGDGQGALGGNTAEGRSYGNLARELRNTLRQTVPEYGTALETAAQPIQARNALEFGSEILSPRIHRDIAAERIGDMTGPELAQARQGLRSQIAETIANTKRTITDPNVDARQAMSLVKQLSSDAAREKMALLVPASEADGMNAALTRATRSLELRAATSTNTRTYGRTATDKAVKETTGPGVLDRLLEGRPLEMGKAVAQAVTGRRPADFARREDALYGELASALTEPRGPAAEGLLERLIRQNDRRQTAQSIAGSVPYGALTQTGILSLLPTLNQRAQ